MPEGGDRDGDGNDNGEGDEIQVQPPSPTPCFTPSRVAAKGPPFAVVEEPNRQLGPTPTRTWVGIPAHNKRGGPVAINGVH